MILERLGKYLYILKKFILLSILLSLGTGCVSIPIRSGGVAESVFEAATEKYARYIRWGYFEEAAGFSRARDGSKIIQDLDDVAKYRVSDYKILSRLLADNGFEGRVLALVEYYHIDSGVLYHLDTEQNWWYDFVKKRWYIYGTLPRFNNAITNE